MVMRASMKNPTTGKSFKDLRACHVLQMVDGKLPRFDDFAGEDPAGGLSALCSCSERPSLQSDARRQACEPFACMSCSRLPSAAGKCLSSLHSSCMCCVQIPDRSSSATRLTDGRNGQPLHAHRTFDVEIKSRLRHCRTTEHGKLT